MNGQASKHVKLNVHTRYEEEASFIEKEKKSFGELPMFEFENDKPFRLYTQKLIADLTPTFTFVTKSLK